LQSYKSQCLHCQQSYEHQNCVSKIFAKKPFSILYLFQKHKKAVVCGFEYYKYSSHFVNNLNSVGKTHFQWSEIICPQVSAFLSQAINLGFFSEKNCYFAFHLNCQVQNRCLFVYWLLNLSQLSLQNNNIIENVGKPQTPLPLNALWMWHK
jgi:hypothetical protein